VPELPDITVYVEALRPRIVGHTLRRLRIRSPFLLRTFEPPAGAAADRRVGEVFRIGKRIAWGLEGDLYLVIHLMIAGRLRWRDGDPDWKPGRTDLAAFEFDLGLLVLTEASQKKRASLHICAGRDAALALHAGGLDLFDCTLPVFAAAITRENRTLKRVLADPRIIDGVGNAYSDEILHAAKLSPLKLTGSLTAEETERLLAAARATLTTWTDRLRADFGLDKGGTGRFPGPGQITAFREGFAVHGRFGKPCPVCGAPVQRIVYAENETNYCPGCQTGGRILADRSLSRLLREDWPRTLEELEG
jgi:formamidopyrimidine-DNA glycosylase